ncbi:MAG: hypothetical protein IJO03_03250 [Clostridia bacterium]|nr:hypothetical protein [Clostridia bacterium]
MKGNIKRILSLVLCAAVLLTTANMAFAQDARAVIDSGYCGAQGENLAWTLYDDGELVISGEGEMDWYAVDWQGNKYAVNNPVKRPGWFGYYDRIYVITVEEGVTSIGNDAFYTGSFSRNFKPSVYYRINLPKSLEYVEKLFDACSRNRIEGKHLAYVYAGSEAEWYHVKHRTSLVVFDENKVPVECAFGSESQDVSPKTFDKYSELYFNGNEPEAFCRIVSSKSGDADLVTHYYSSSPKAEMIEWYAVNNGEETKIGEIPTGEHEAETIVMPNYKEGNVYLRAKLIDADGNVILISKDYFLGTEISFLTRMKMYFQIISFYFQLFPQIIKLYFQVLLGKA